MDNCDKCKWVEPQVDHKAKAYIAPKKPLVPNNSSSNVTTGMLASISSLILSGLFLGSKAPGSGGPKPKPKWGGADICPR